MTVVIAFLPQAGLGNKLFVWARALSFAALNGFPHYALGWSYPRLGPILRGERRESGYGRWIRQPKLERRFYAACTSMLMSRRYEPDIALIREPTKSTVYIFRKIPHWKDFFGSLHSTRALITESFVDLIDPRLRAMVSACAPPAIAVHVRRGDFRKLRPGEKFSEVGSVQTPIEYFIEVITRIRSSAGWNVPVTVFSDGTDAELKALLSEVIAVERAPKLPDIGHLLLMSRADIIVASAGSTFSMWAGFLSDAAIILHPDHLRHAPIRPPFRDGELFEGPASGTLGGWDPRLTSKIRSIHNPKAASA